MAIEALHSELRLSRQAGTVKPRPIASLINFAFSINYLSLLSYSFSYVLMYVVLESFRSKRDDLENEMQLKYNVYSTMSTQYQDAKARVQERTPAFTILKGASVPIKPTGPKRMLFVLAMTMLAFFVLTLWSVREYLLKD